MKKTPRAAMTFISLMVILLFCSGCFENSVTKTVHALDTAISALENESADWQQVLEETIDKLTDDAQSTIRNEVSNVLTRSIAASGAEVKCVVDFIRTRARDDLIRLRAHLLNQPAEAKEPIICSVTPLSVDAALVPSKLKILEFYGYDFDTTPIQVLLQNDNRDVSQFLAYPTHYHMTLNLGTNGVQLSRNSNLFILKWKTRVISTISISQTNQPTPTPQAFDYRVDIYTWNRKSASAAEDGRVWITIVGTKRSTREIEFPGNFRQGEIESKIIHNEDLGTIQYIKVRYDDGDENNAWDLGWISVLNMATNMKIFSQWCQSKIDGLWLGNQAPLEGICKGPTR